MTETWYWISEGTDEPRPRAVIYEAEFSLTLDDGTVVQKDNVGSVRRKTMRECLEWRLSRLNNECFRLQTQITDAKNRLSLTTGAICRITARLKELSR
jgi:hypothetical protein